MNDVTLPNKRPGGRSAQVQAQVRTALEELVAEQGRERVTVPAVAERAGVSASSIYRRWGDLQGLLAETATHRLDPNRPLPDTGTLRQDLEAWARELIEHLAKSPAGMRARHRCHEGKIRRLRHGTRELGTRPSRRTSNADP